MTTQKYDFTPLLVGPADRRERSRIAHDEIDMRWADCGATLHRRVTDPTFVHVVMMASLQAGHPRDLAERLRAYILNGTLPR